MKKELIKIISIWATQHHVLLFTETINNLVEDIGDNPNIDLDQIEQIVITWVKRRKLIMGSKDTIYLIKMVFEFLIQKQKL
jgi:hypothetical protein